jgi:hypothetical protein
MKIQVKIIKENPDGSANAEVDFDKEGLETLVQWGLISLLTTAVDEYKVEPEVVKPNKRKKVNEPLFTGNLASNKLKTSRVRSKK